MQIHQSGQQGAVGEFNHLAISHVTDRLACANSSNPLAFDENTPAAVRLSVCPDLIRNEENAPAAHNSRPVAQVAW
jgi:hypothetical protein